MNKPSNNPTEKELHQFSPRPVSSTLRANLAAALHSPALATPSLNSAPNTPAHLSPALSPHLPRRPSLSFSDRCLLTAMTLGALAACLIITFLSLDSLTAAPAPSTSPPALAQSPPLTPASYQRLLAELTNHPEKPL